MPALILCERLKNQISDVLLGEALVLAALQKKYYVVEALLLFAEKDRRVSMRCVDQALDATTDENCVGLLKGYRTILKEEALL